MVVMGSRRMRPPGLTCRWATYVSAGALVAIAVLTRPQLPAGGLVLVAALTAAHMAALLFPVSVGTAGPWRGRRCLDDAPLAVMSLVLAPTTALLMVAFSAVAAGVHIRKYRTTPGGMAMGASRTILRGAVVFTVVDLMPTGTALHVIVALYVAFNVERLAGLPPFFSLVHIALSLIHI